MTFIYRPLPSSADVTVICQTEDGTQLRAELTMPVFRASGGIGCYWLGGLKCVYETLAFKVDVTRSLFLNIGYCFYNYHYTNNLMLGIGYRLRT